MLTFDRASVGYDGRVVLKDLSLRLDSEDRIALLGPNGRGKSTFAKMLAGRLAPMGGSQFRANGLTVGYFAQHQTEELDAEESPLAHMQRAMPKATVTAARAQLARFGLDADRAETKSGELSGGERARLLLSLATRDAPQLLILDEPTNHLDIDARDALVRALASFEGAVLLISHDPHLVELVADTLWIVGDGTVTPYEGDLADYKARIAEGGKAPAAKAPNAAPNDRKGKALARAALEPLRKRARDAEARLTRLAEERRTIEAKLADPAIYRKGGSDLARENARLSAVARAEAQAESDWLEAAGALEEAVAT
jgi:ATP-binding cassette subfamily F protein 3